MTHSGRSPGDQTPYTVSAKDTFDREADPVVDRSGVGILEGLTELWRRVLREGIRDNSDASFTAFSLGWDDPSVETGTDWTSIAVAPFDNHDLAKLRRWIYGKPGPGEESKGPNEIPPLPVERQNTALEELAGTYAALIPFNPRATSGWHKNSEAAQILRETKAARTLEELLERLARLRERSRPT